MRYRHRDGGDAPGAITLSAVRDDADVDGDGVFTVDEDREDFDDVHERLVEAGHEPVDTGDGDDSGDQEGDAEDSDAADTAETSDADVDDSEEEAPRASDYTEDELLEMDWGPMTSLAAEYDDIPGSGISGERMTELLIEQRRKEVDE